VPRPRCSKPSRNRRVRFGDALVAVLLAIAAVGCGGARSPAPGTPTAVTTGSPAVGDWVALFDGTATPGLRAYGGGPFPTGSWRIDDGALTTIPGQPVDLATEETYADFELEFTWRVTPGGNSGVMIRVDEGAQVAWMSGPEYQILDDIGHGDGATPRTSAGALYDLMEPGPAKSLAPVGEDNRSRIVVRDGRVEHWLNDALVLAYTWRGPEVLALIEASKFRDLAGFMAADEGRIVFQHHGEEVAFGLIRVRRL
jgi:hypothetical protein